MGLNVAKTYAVLFCQNLELIVEHVEHVIYQLEFPGAFTMNKPSVCLF